MEIPRWKLSALAYPRASAMRVGDEQECMNLVLFLENRHIRHLDISERRPLEGSPSPAWHAFLGTYLAATGCPLLAAPGGYAQARLAEYLHWLVGHAVSLNYEENFEALNRDAAEAEAVAAAAGGGGSGGAGAGGAQEQEDPPVPQAAAAIIEELARVCNINAGGRSHFKVLQAVGRALRQRILPAAAAHDAALAMEGEEGMAAGGGGSSSSSSSSSSSASSSSSSSASSSSSSSAGGAKISAALELAAKDPMSSLANFVAGPLPPPGARRAARKCGTLAASAPPATSAGPSAASSSTSSSSSARGVVGGSGAAAADLGAFPLGFATGDAVVDYASSLLRMLYIADLRELQDSVNEILITVQEFTADPKTDSSLGKVGR